MQRILTGEQYMTIYLDIRAEAEKSAELAVALAKGEKPSGADQGQQRDGRRSRRSCSTRSR